MYKWYCVQCCIAALHTVSWNHLQYQFLASTSTGKSCCRDPYMGRVSKGLLNYGWRMLTAPFKQQSAQRFSRVCFCSNGDYG
jgi:hypothetical protein